MFYTKRYNAAGIFCVHLFINGVKTAVIVDDYFPVHEWGDPAFAHSKKKELWVNILEKAWAKVHGSYAATEGAMSMSCAVSHLSGAPGFEIDVEYVLKSTAGEDGYFKTLRQMLSKQFNLSTGTNSSANKEKGLVPGHAYTI